MGKFETKYSIKQKLLIGFSIVLILLVAVVISTYMLNSKIMNYTNEIRNVEAPLELMVQQVIGYDAMLTGYAHAALLHAENGERDSVAVHRAQYDEIGLNLDNLLKNDAKELLELSKRSDESKQKVNEYLKRLDEVNLILVDLETNAFNSMDFGDYKLARSYIVSDNYDSYKKELYGLYLDWADVESEVTENYRMKVLSISRQIIWINLIGGIIAIIIGIVVALVITRAITNPLNELEYVADELISGNLNVKISGNLKNTKGVIGRLSQAYDKLIQNSQMGLRKFVEYKVEKFKR